MCGIGVTVDLARRGRARPWARGLLAHRGPDSSGIEVSDDGNVVLEHTRLAIIDPENREADQPFWDGTRRWAMTYNGEIFNYREIRTELEREGAQFRTNSDTEVVLAGFLRHGEQIVERLRGMFAFAIWDSHTGDVFLARDHVGVKPLYYFINDGLFAAASEVRPLLANPRAPTEFDHAGVIEFLAFGSNFGERTLVDHVRKLPPGHWMRVGYGRPPEIRRYWDILEHGCDSPSDQEAPDQLRDLLDGAVSASLVSDVPVGLMLSGGLDSSTIAVLAARHIDPHDLTAYSVSFDRPDDESTVAARLAAELGIRHRTIMLSEAQVEAEFDTWLRSVDYPSGDPTWIATWVIARAAHEDGIKVLLGGDGGDEIFGGYNRWMRYLRFHDRYWQKTPQFLRKAAGHAARPRARGLAGDIARRARSGGELFVPSRPMHDDMLAAILGPVGLAALSDSPPELVLSELNQEFRTSAARADYLGWMSYVSLKTKLVEDFLQRLDKMGMQHSVEGRVPLLDPRLVEWSFSVPQAMKVGSFQQKLLFRKAVEPILPRFILDRPKQGFSPPATAWAEALLERRGHGVARELVDTGLIRPDVARALRREGGSWAAWTLGTLCEWIEEIRTPSAAAA